MNSKLFFQKNEINTMSQKITENFENKPKKVYVFSGAFKEGGFNILEEEFIDSKSKIYIAIGIDKKNTTKSMLDSLIKYTKDVYIFNNNEIIEFDSSVLIFEYQDKAIMYNLSSNISESGLLNNNSLYLETIYDLKNTEDKKSYKDTIKTITLEIEDENSNFTKLTSDMVDELQNNKEIFTTKQYVHNVKSISELLGKEPNIKPEKKEMTKNEIEDIYVSNIEIPKIDITDDDFDLGDIDISDLNEEPVIKNEEQKEEAEKEIHEIKSEDVNQEELENIDDIEDNIDIKNELYDEELENVEFDGNSTLDIANMLFSKADLKLDVDSAKKEIKENENIEYDSEDEELVKVKKLNLNNISNFIYELPSKSAKFQNVIKIPNYISKMIPNFFELSDNSKTVEKEDGIYKIRNINLELVDVKTNNKYTDREAQILYKVGQSFVQIISETFKNIEYEELDIARIIKLDSKVYHIEVIPTDMQEYKLWSKLCNQEFKSSKRKYGMM